MHTEPKRIAVTWHPQLPSAKDEAEKIAAAINAAGTQAEAFSLYNPVFRSRIEQESYDVLITLGGDGTMLRAGKLCAPLQIPVMGINMGSFGFLIETQQHEWPKMITPLLSGDWKTEVRMMIRAKLISGNGTSREWEALNDVVLARASALLPIRVNVRISGALLTDYVADGLIVSTATGSTAYAMAVGGPVLQPELRNMLVIPIAPHLSLDRGLILQEGETVQISLNSDRESIFSADGTESVVVRKNDRIEVSSSSHSARFVRFQDNGFFYSNFIQYVQRNPSAGRRNV